MHRWINYDLHMHSEHSEPFDGSKVKKMSAKDYVDILLKKHVDVFSLTDHNCLNATYYKELFEYIEDKPIKLIPGCEFNIYVDVANHKKFQANIYFPVSTDLDVLEKAINDIYDNGKLPSLSEVIDGLNSSHLSFIIFPEADKDCGGIGNIWRTIRKNGEVDRFLKNGMQRVFKAYDSTDAFDKTSANMWAKSYFEKTEEFKELVGDFDDDKRQLITGFIVDKIKGKSIDCGEYNELVEKLTSIIVAYGQCFSYFHFSDWHNAQDYNPKHKNMIYGNDQLPFETLELAVYDPFSRIEILDASEEKETPLNTIKSLSFNMNGNDYHINFSQGLNSIVGERASGKSLLVAILLKLFDKDDLNLEKYKGLYHVDRETIKCVTYDNQELSVGQLGSLKYIEQNSITQIFTNPDFSQNELKKNYLDLPEIDMTPFENLISELKKFKPLEFNYKSVSSFINFSNRISHYSYAAVKKINLTDIKTSYTQLVGNFNTFVSSVRAQGLSGNEFVEILNLFKKESSKLSFKIKKYNEIFDSINLKINELNKNVNTVVENLRLANADYNNSKQIIEQNFERLLNYKKIEHLILNFKMITPDIEINKRNKYLFISSCSISENLTSAIMDAITGNILKHGGKNDMALLKAYLFGETKLKASSSNIYANLEKKFVSDNVQKEYRMYEIKNDFEVPDTISNDFIEQLIREQKIEDISNSSLGRKSIAYLDLILDSDASILVFDQPEDNVDNRYISNFFVPLIKIKKKAKQLIFVTHNPSVAVYADSFNYIYATNNNDNEIEYNSHFIESYNDKKRILEILDGGPYSFSNRNFKYGSVIGEHRYDTND